MNKRVAENTTTSLKINKIQSFLSSCLDLSSRSFRSRSASSCDCKFTDDGISGLSPMFSIICDTSVKSAMLLNANNFSLKTLVLECNPEMLAFVLSFYCYFHPERSPPRKTAPTYLTSLLRDNLSKEETEVFFFHESANFC